MTTLTYCGSELDIFAKAVRWKAYWRQHILPFTKGDVLEVGAGIGANTEGFTIANFRSWTCLEPDPELCATFRVRRETVPNLHVIVGTVADLPEEVEFDSILYIDVLEHIEDDHEEMASAAMHLRRGGHLIVLSPAYQWLFTPFDSAIGHFRRYTANSLSAVTPPGLRLLSVKYLDATGMLASLGNRLLLRQSYPSESQIRFWDNYMVPVSRVIDPIVGHRCGKSVVGVWER